jgi:hypothetical protein
VPPSLLGVASSKRFVATSFFAHIPTIMSICRGRIFQVLTNENAFT